MSSLSGGQCRKTWHFTSVLTPTHEINEDFFQLAFHTDRQNVNIERASINVVGDWIKRQVLNVARPTCINFISWRFSRTDVADWFSKTEARTPLQDLLFEGYIQASHAIDFSRLTYWIRDAHWNPLGMKLADCEAYNGFCASGDAYEVCTDGKPAVSRAGRPKKNKVATQRHMDAYFHYRRILICAFFGNASMFSSPLYHWTYSDYHILTLMFSIPVLSLPFDIPIAQRGSAHYDLFIN